MKKNSRRRKPENTDSANASEKKKTIEGKTKNYNYNSDAWGRNSTNLKDSQKAMLRPISSKIKYDARWDRKNKRAQPSRHREKVGNVKATKEQKEVFPALLEDERGKKGRGDIGTGSKGGKVVAQSFEEGGGVFVC